ncbi:MFS transporter [Sinorhizobium medicae]|uniref:Major facilitator superfamily MFS_1 n=2 Tax=Sinorhizobium medicae TaxID=110321 RepID=A6UE80_SINMW|nr:MFS transporter [Sinorhizobium medicae]ABR61960.1 major facilitator superfamily MFS_1 [Sinorhizobium medicae WSM419]MBO1941158.1 MFS transporter [Sinorhizobium medicae]MBO1964404.1 MFS transporter [Sinorhizobium medicae]MDX0956928.1 MFS transporter [Sinorhizobium medicae]PLT93585.1 MFS transporter [Sinorhizobium medicae]
MDQRTDSAPQAIGRQGYMSRNRLAVSLLFLMNGFVTGSWAPKIPEFKERLGIGESVLGLLILGFGVGSLVLMPIAGGFIARLGSQKVVKVTAIILSPLLLLLTLLPNLWTAALGLFLLGGFVGAMDVAMNANAVEVEKSMRRAIMSSCHAYWSLGGLIGAGIGGFLMARFGVLPHAMVVTVLCLVILAVAWPMILADRPHLAESREKLRLPMTPLPWLIGIMALFSMVPEGAVLDWGALYLKNELGASVELSGFGFAAFSATMAAMRFAGDHVRDRFGAKRTLRISTVTALAGMVLAGLAPNAVLAILGFALAGVGISNMVPIAFSAAGNMPGLQPGIGLSVATTMGYSGMLFAPSLIGFIAEHSGFAIVFACVPVLFIVVLLLSHHAVHADHAKG